MQNFEVALTGGHPNSLGNTVAVVDEVLERPERFEELFNCYFSKDEVVRLRTSNAMKRIAKADKSLLIPYLDKFLNDIAKIEQDSAQWTLAQLFELLEKDMTVEQIAAAKQLLKVNLENYEDWIVLNMTMQTLGKWAKKDEALKKWLLPKLRERAKDERKSVAKRANKILQQLEGE